MNIAQNLFTLLVFFNVVGLALPYDVFTWNPALGIGVCLGSC